MKALQRINRNPCLALTRMIDPGHPDTMKKAKKVAGGASLRDSLKKVSMKHQTDTAILAS
jgi:hypothetical protein